MSDKNKHEDILYDFIFNFLNFAFLIESIVGEPEEALLTGGYVGKTYYSKLTQEQKKAIENRAMEEVKRHFENKEYKLTDVSLQRGIGYDYIATHNLSSDKLFLEVKGTTVTEDWTINLTANEFKASETFKERFILVVVEFDNVETLNLNKISEYQYPTKNRNLSIQASEYYVSKL